MPGKGRMSITGNLKDVMKELIAAAASLRPLAGDHASASSPADVREDRRPRARAGRRDAQGRSVGRRRHGGRHHLGAHRHPDPQGPRHDRRDHPARPGAADRRPEGEAARGAALGRQDGADPAREREGPGRGAGEREGGAGDHPGLHRRRGAGQGADRAADRRSSGTPDRRRPVAGRRRGRRGRRRRLRRATQSGRGRPRRSRRRRAAAARRPTSIDRKARRGGSPAPRSFDGGAAWAFSRCGKLCGGAGRSRSLAGRRQ